MKFFWGEAEVVRHKITRTIVSFVLLAISPAGAASSPIFNLPQIRQDLGLSFFDRVHRSQFKKKVRIAILDRGFQGHKKEIGKSLPSSTRYFAGPIKTSERLKTNHGLVMAQIVSGLLQKSKVDYQLELYNVAGFSNLKAGISRAIKRKVDIVLHSEVWDYGNNWDGKGFINKEVSRATAAGILWINAAGNFAKSTYNTPIFVMSNDWVGLPDENTGLKIICEQNPRAKNKKCPLRIVASWNSYGSKSTDSTDKDIDIALFDDFMTLREKAELKQTSDSRKNKLRGYSRFPREIIEAEVPLGTYYIKAKARSKNFAWNKDSLRITVGGEFFKMPRYDQFESLHHPADNPTVITVGASDSVKSSRSQRHRKPELLAKSSVRVKQGEYRGSSNSAAMVAAVAVNWLGVRGQGRPYEFISFYLRLGTSNSTAHNGAPLRP